MKVTIEIAMNNAAFADCPSIEVARILRQYADLISDGATDWYEVPLYDIAGNRVGRAVVE